MRVDFKGPFGVYYREIFFHIPFLIANHLNSSQKFAEAQKWYHYIFNPMAKRTGTEDEPTDRNWRYVEFRRFNDPMTLREQLTHPMSIETYKRDPFNPHAIARLRLSAYQKAIVMKYIDNLLDWGDHLFAQDTMESINEATLLYVLASDILGDRPEQIGECDAATGFSMTYEQIAESPFSGGEFLMEMAHFSGRGETDLKSKGKQYAQDPVTIARANERAALFIRKQRPSTTGRHTMMGGEATPYGLPANSPRGAAGVGAFGNRVAALPRNYSGAGTDKKSSNSGIDVLKWYLAFMSSLSLRPVFCIPPNEILLGYWDRVEERLYNIRHCMNISGVRREISLFAPEIDPMLLVRGKAAGITIDEVLSSVRGSMPPYRFSYIIERAKGYAATLQGFGAALLAALEKKDVEELNQIRAVQQQNILKRTSQMKQWELDAADEAYQGALKRQETISYRHSYYQRLVSDGLSNSEHIQQAMGRAATGWRLAAGALDIIAGISHLIPELGSPFALKFGGRQLGDSSGSWSKYFRVLAEMYSSIASQAGLEAGFARRRQGWEHQAELASRELEEIEKQIEIAKIRIDIAKQSKEVHEKAIEQQQEIYDFFKDKFSNLGLYTWLSTTLQRLYRDAYNNAYAMAKLAEQAYRFERGDDAAELIGPNHWEASKAGLMAGERLLIDLQNLERRFLETNYRSLEIDQSFSLTQIAPAALILLKETGECSFEIPEIFFDLFYPGHYKRKIKSARLTIPCITGPYTNVSATLSLVSSSLRKEPKPGPSYLLDVPRSRSVTIATSTAQNDAGVFELNFRDERYMPFEGAGAISSWHLSLPKNFRQFDYQTINDVIIHISYTAEQDNTFRATVEDQNGAVEGAINFYLTETENSLPRVFSFRQEFSREFNRLIHSPAGTSVPINITDKHFPIFLKGKNLVVDSAYLLLRTSEDPGDLTVAISINDETSEPTEETSNTYGFTWEPEDSEERKWGGLPYSADVKEVFASGLLDNNDTKYSFAIETPGNLGPESPAPGDVSAIDSEKLSDIYLCVNYKLGA